MYSKRIDYLKGFVICAVLINHYLNSYISGNQAGFANGFVSLFFLTAGYLTYFSFEKRYKKNHKVALKFYLSRFFRLFPLYWFTLIVGIFVFQNKHGLIEFTAIRSIGIFWFISALFHCYLFCFLFYYMLKKFNVTKYILIISLSFMVLNFLYFLKLTQNFILFDYINKISALKYRDLFLSHILLFGLGMSTPLLHWGQNLIKKIKEHYLFIILFVLIFLTRTKFDSCIINKISSIGFIFGVFLIFSLFNFRKSKLVFNRTLSFLGKYSLSIYLFHLFFYEVLSRLGVVQKNSIFSIFLTLISLPIFFAFCILTEKIFRGISRSVQELMENY